MNKKITYSIVIGLILLSAVAVVYAHGGQTSISYQDDEHQENQDYSQEDIEEMHDWCEGFHMGNQINRVIRGMM